MKSKKRTPWRDNIEAMTMAVIMALVLKYFIIEAYKIPTGSMQPTLMGNEHTGVFDRILVDKFSFRLREPERFEVVVFRYPLDRSKNFVKRIVGMPGDQLRIRNGDVWSRASKEDVWSPLRRPRTVQRDTWKRLDLKKPKGTSWKVVSTTGNWKCEARRIEARGAGKAGFRPGIASVMDNYVDGYPDGMISKLPPRGAGENPVGDLRLTGRVSALPGCERVELELTEGNKRYLFKIPGPTAPEGSLPEIVVIHTRLPADTVVLKAEQPYRLPAGKKVSFEIQNLDDLLELRIRGDLVCSLEVDTVEDQRSSVSIGLEGEGADFDELMVLRDIYYVATSAKSAEVASADGISVPEGSYFMLGDNTQDSSDSREWMLARYRRMEGDGEESVVIRGNSRRPENPRIVPGGPRGTETWFRDEWGETHRFLPGEVQQLPPVGAPFVPRNMILGRAMAVFWPIAPRLGVYRLKWVY